MRPMQIASLAYSALVAVMASLLAATPAVFPQRVAVIIGAAMLGLAAVANQIFPRSFTTPTGAFTQRQLDKLDAEAAEKAQPPEPEEPGIHPLPKPPEEKKP